MPDDVVQEPELAQLQELARAHGVGIDFWGFYGDLHPVPARTLTSVLGALGVDATTSAAVEQSRAEAADDPWRRILPPTVVKREWAPSKVHVHVLEGDPVRVWVIDETGHEWPTYRSQEPAETRDVDGVRRVRLGFWVPQELPLGWHVLRAESQGRHAEAALVVVPERVPTLDTLAARTGRERTWGLMVQLYSVRSRRSWGIGDLADLADLAAIAGAAGADWMLVNPLHAAEPRPPVQASPYLPTTRRFFSPLYIRVEAIPELAYLPAVAQDRVRTLAAETSRGNGDASTLCRDPAYAAKLEALELVYAVPRSPARQAHLAAFLERTVGLADFALWCALREERDEDDERWERQSADGAGSQDDRDRLADRIELHCWMQWVLDEQLEAAQAAACAAGMGVGIVHDLAVGVHPAGADAWLLRDVLAQQAEVGAPPDMYNQQGQNWSQPPWHPQGLAEAGYAPFRDMLRALLRHAGGLRIDHVLGLFRLWWVPKGLPPDQGAYVYYDHEALIGILCLEAQRAGAVVIGEDLGTFEPWVRDYLAGRGLLGTSILWFEQAADKTPLPPEHYRRDALASVNTHDLPPTAGYLRGEHISVRDRLGLLTRPVEVERAADLQEQERVEDMCRRRGLLDADAGEQQTVEALYRLLAQAPSVMQGVALVDAVGERRVQNQPGTDKEYPNWRVPLAGPDARAVLVDDLVTNERAQSLFRVVDTALR
ncbi:MAG: 4-alpha-glucanotransferase [Dermatophilaceae bacterium]